MKLQNPYLKSIGVATVLGWLSWFLVIQKTSPFISVYWALSLFYTSWFLAMAGTFTLLIYYLRLWLQGGAEQEALTLALREGVLLSALITVVLVFQRLRVLTWWDALLLLAIVVLIEFYFLGRD